MDLLDIDWTKVEQTRRCLDRSEPRAVVALSMRGALYTSREPVASGQSTRRLAVQQLEPRFSGGARAFERAFQPATRVHGPSLAVQRDAK
jgi:hypothetical protein